MMGEGEEGTCVVRSTSRPFFWLNWVNAYVIVFCYFCCCVL